MAKITTKVATNLYTAWRSLNAFNKKTWHLSSGTPVKHSYAQIAVYEVFFLFDDHSLTFPTAIVMLYYDSNSKKSAQKFLIKSANNNVRATMQ